ncbi:hypothetical protein OOU_Y34scaffold00993g2 [Pyricularia oryzae Y34]|uniref:Uncharacterized protein n=2 Tax=Pyricularia oryzae TaxID=318829 RepID=A0AA97PFZ4_PYRO3|nr:hypothetical protein OOU_Y34scaffold00993g2 [Pyricularia oryzae Y34]
MVFEKFLLYFVAFNYLDFDIIF